MLGIFRARDLSFRPGYNLTKRFSMQLEKSRNTFPSHQVLPSTESENPLKIRLIKNLIPFQKLKLKDLYLEQQSQKKISEAYGEKWE